MTKEQRYAASYVIEVQTPFSEEHGFDLETAPDLIDQTGEVWNSGCGLGARDASGPANFNSLCDAYKWQRETQATLDAKYGDGEGKAMFWLEGEDDDMDIFYVNPPDLTEDLDEIEVTQWLSLEVELENEDEEAFHMIKWSQVDVEPYTPLDQETQAALDQAAKTEAETIATHKEALAEKRF